MTSVSSPRHEGFESGMLDKRLDEIERAMCGPLSPAERRALRSEYIELTNPRKDVAA